MKIFIAADHAGLPLKEELKKNTSLLRTSTGEKIEWIDLGTHNLDSVDYPDYANILCKELLAAQPDDIQGPFGVLICGSGVGISIAANRFGGIRAVLAESETVAKLSREHNHANVLCMGARIVNTEKAVQILNAFLTAIPDQGPRHLNRIQKLSQKGGTCS